MAGVMMNHDKHKVSFGIAKELKESGYPQGQVEWYWLVHKTDNIVVPFLKRLFDCPRTKLRCSEYYDFYDAPTVGELGEMLPNGSYSIKEGDVWHCWLRTGRRRVEEKTEVNARAKLWLWLKQNGYLKGGEE